MDLPLQSTQIPAARPGQTLEDHLNNVANRAAQFGAKFRAKESCYAAGIFHDAGKASLQWQSYLASDDHSGRVTHAPESAALASELLGNLATFIIYAIRAHHSHLPNWYACLDNIHEEYKEDVRKACETAHLLPNIEGLKAKLTDEYLKLDVHAESLPLQLRMLCSALVDADRLDAEAFETPEQAALRGNCADWHELEAKFDGYMAEKRAAATPSPVNTLRSAALNEVLEKAQLKPGVFTLNIPTGGGKTLTSMAFALRHRAFNKLDRIIMTIPFNSIIEQTAAIYKDIFGSENVLEHHSGFNLNDHSAARLAAENWDMPIVVTTNVQLFESLLKSGASGVRKLHNICNSIIILDEAQMLPSEHLVPLLATLRALVMDFGCTVVLCSATIPALVGDIAKSDTSHIEGLPEATPLISNPDAMFKALSRTRIFHKPECSWEMIAAELAEAGQVLCIVNTKRACRQLYELVDAPRKVHLSGNMCPAERSEILQNIRTALAKGEDIVIISTSLIECGVDIDVRTVYRELAGADSIAQAAGRCNREGKMTEPGRVFTFKVGEPPPSLRIGYNVARDLIQSSEDGEWHMTPEFFRKYFTLFYGNCRSFDTAGYSNCFHDPLRYDFRRFSEKFNMIENDYQQPLVVLYGDSADLIEELRQIGSPTRSLLRRLQRYTVNVAKDKLELWMNENCVENIGGIDVQIAPGLYVPGLGISDNDNFCSY